MKPTPKKSIIKDPDAFFEGHSTLFPEPENSDIERDLHLSTDESTSQLTDQSANLLNDQMTKKPTDNPDNLSSTQSTIQPVSYDASQVLGRPKSFYITSKQNDDLDRLVEKLKKKLIGKIPDNQIDRSSVVRLIFEEINLLDGKTTDKLASRLVNRLITQLTRN
jgi:hypothetical protein